MKILIVSNYLPDRQISMQAFAQMLERGLKARECEVRTVRPEAVFCRSGNSTAGFSKWLGYIDKFVLFPHGLKKEAQWADIVHICDHSNAMYVNEIAGKPHLVTCNDLLAVRSAFGEFPENPTGLTGRILQKWILSGLKKAKRICCISEATRRDLLRVSGIPDVRASVVYMGFNYDYKPMTKDGARRHLETSGFRVSEPFFLHVGKSNWYKNRVGAAQIFLELCREKAFAGHSMVFAGAPLSRPVQEFVKKENIESKVIVLKDLKCEDLRALYSLAEALIYPSIAEGFGWPIIEAQTCGCPVFTTGRAPMTEAGGDAAVYFDPDQPEEAAKKIAEALSDNAKAEEMKRKGFENIKRFSTDRMIDEYVGVYEELLAESK